MFINHKGKRRSKKIGTKKAANAAKREVEARLAQGDMGMVKERCPTLAVYGREWLNLPIREWRDSTRKTYADVLDLHINPALGNNRLDEVKRRDIKLFISSLKKKGLSSARAKVVMAVVSGMFENAIEDELIETNPCRNTRKHCGNNTVTQMNPLSDSEVQTLLDNASLLPLAEYAFYLMSVRTGLRVGELLALQWSDIDFEARTVEINKTYNYQAKQIGPPKNKKIRTLDLTPVTTQIICDLRCYQRVSWEEDFVFTDEKGKIIDYQRLYKLLKKIAPRRIRIHDLRHTYATMRIAKGDNILDVSKQLGHHSVAFTLDQYAHWMPGEHKLQVDELDNIAPIRTLSAPTDTKTSFFQ